MNYASAYALIDSDMYRSGTNWEIPPRPSQSKIKMPTQHIQALVPNYQKVSEEAYEEFKCRFNELVGRWTEEVEDMSSFSDMVLHQDYRTISGMGPRAIRLLLKELQTRPHFWFDALRTILLADGEDVDPVDNADRGDLRKMSDAWIEWGKTEGYI